LSKRYYQLLAVQPLFAQLLSEQPVFVLQLLHQRLFNYFTNFSSFQFFSPLFVFLTQQQLPF
jgi:hypothetical protein